MDNERVEAAIESLRAGVDALRELDRTRLDAAQLTGLLCSVEQVRRQLDGIDHHTLAEVKQRNIAGEYGRNSTGGQRRHAARADRPDDVEILHAFLGILDSGAESVVPRG